MSDGRRYLWFAPFAGLWPWFRLEHRLADALQRSGRSVTMVHCNGVLDSFCPVMAAQNLTVDSTRKDKARSCKECRFNKRLATERASYGHLELDAAVTPSSRERARATLAAVTPDNWEDLEIDGVPIGRYSTYLAMLRHKVTTVTDTKECWTEYRSDLFDSLLVFSALPAILDEVQPTHAVVYNPLYPVNRAFAERVRQRGIPLVGVHAGGFIPNRYDSAGVYHHISASQTTVDSNSISASLEVPCTPLEVAAIGSHVRELIGGGDPWVYSSAPTRTPAYEVRRALGVRPTSDVVVALISSPDETRASLLVDAEYHRDAGRGFSDIPEFLEAIRGAAELLPAVDFVIRLHPRLMPNKRERVTSPDHEVIVRALSDLPSNAVVNATTDGLSLYDVMMISSAALNQSSSAGLEFLLMGLPVVQYDPLRQNAYPPEFGPCAERRDATGLVEAIGTALEQGWSLENSRRAFRWYATTLLRVLLRLNPLPEPAPQGERTAPAVAPAPEPSGIGRLARAVTPRAGREVGARWLDRRARGGTLPPPDQEQQWAAEWLARIDAAAGDGVVWEPPVIRRGEGDEADETRAIHELVSSLLASLGARDGDGVGAIRAALATPPAS